MDLNEDWNGSGKSLTRRQGIVGAVMAIGGMLFAATRVKAESDDGLVHNAEAIHQETILKASAKRIYEALVDEKQFQKVELASDAMKASDLIAKPAQISRETGGPISIFGGYITGRQLELVPNKRIVQAWREGGWPAGVYSIVRFELVEQGAETKIVFDHTGFPAGAGEHLAVGWKSHYWGALQTYLG